MTWLSFAQRREYVAGLTAPGDFVGVNEPAISATKYFPLENFMLLPREFYAFTPVASPRSCHRLQADGTSLSSHITEPVNFYGHAGLAWRRSSNGSAVILGCSIESPPQLNVQQHLPHRSPLRLPSQKIPGHSIIEAAQPLSTWCCVQPRHSIG